MYLLRQRPLFAFAVFFGAGVTAAYLFDVSSFIMLCFAGMAGFAAASAMFAGRGRGIMASIATVLFFISVAFCGSAYFAAKQESRPYFENIYGAKFSGRVTGSPYIDEDGQRLVCTLDDIRVNGEAVEYNMRLYLRGGFESLSEIGCGQYVRGTGHLYYAEASSNPHEFDFGDYLWREGLAGYLTSDLDRANVTGSRGGFADRLYRMRVGLGMRIDENFPKSNELVRALVLGDKRDMSDNIRDDFNTVGVAHLLAISGLHITLVALFVSYLLKFSLGIWPSTVFTLVCIIAYGLFIGFSPSVSRAVLMYTVLCGAPLFGKPTEGSTRLALAFLIILLINPLNIADAGFIMSFSASAGLIWISRPLMRVTRLDRIGKCGGFRGKAAAYPAKLMGATLSAQLFTYPSIAHFYNSFSVISVFSNILLVPFCLVSLIAAYIGLAVPQLAFIPDNMLAFLRYIVGICADISWAAVAVPSPPAWLWLGIFAIGIAASELSRLRDNWRPWLIPAIPLMIIVSLLFVSGADLSIVFLDVGQADSAVIRTDGVTCVVDLGEDGYEAANYITGENLSVDSLFLSHPHSDHAGGLGEFITECEVGTIYIPADWFDEMEGAEMTEEWALVESMKIPYVLLEPGDTVRLTDDAVVTILDCAENTGDKGNDMSLIMLLDYGDSEVLFTGDANVGNAPDADVLKVGHHGSISATDEVVAGSVSPSVAVISVGRNSYGHPSSAVISALRDVGADVYRTDECGAVTVTMDKRGNIEVTTFREDSK